MSRREVQHEATIRRVAAEQGVSILKIGNVWHLSGRHFEIRTADLFSVKPQELISRSRWGMRNP